LIYLAAAKTYEFFENCNKNFEVTCHSERVI
jgi:hypothetical protein